MKGQSFHHTSVTSAVILFFVQRYEREKQKKQTMTFSSKLRDGGGASTKRLKIMDVNWIKWARWKTLAVRSELL